MPYFRHFKAGRIIIKLVISDYNRNLRCIRFPCCYTRSICISLLTAAVAVALKEASHPSFAEYIGRVKENAAVLGTHLQSHGYSLVTGGTDNHLVLWDARSTGLSGAKLEKLLEACEISVNKNSIVGDTSAVSPGGVRLGTLAMTTRGVSLKDMKFIADTMHRAVELGHRIEKATVVGFEPAPKKLSEFLAIMHAFPFADEILKVKEEVHNFAAQFPLPGLQP